VAYDVARGDWRSFRLDRLAAPRGTGSRFAPRTLPADDAAAFVRAGIDTRRPTYAVEVVVVAPAAEVRLRIGQWATVEENSAGSCLVRMEPDDLSWPAMALGTVGAEFTVVSPPELRDLLRDWGARFGRAAAATAPAA
jgi:predicted DNA-binding transcriptional regulator YafY